MKSLIPLNDVERRIYLIRGQRVMLDHDLAEIYGVTTKRLNEQVKRNRGRFPPDFAFQLTSPEWALLRARDNENRSRFATGSQKHRDPRSRPCAFTEHGAIMAANVLRSARAAQMSVFVVRAFVKMRAVLADNGGLAEKLATLEKEIMARLDTHETAIVDVLQKLMVIIKPPPEPPQEPKPRIGFSP